MLLEPLTILDLEATGLDLDGGDRLTEIGLVRIERGSIVARWSSLVNCGRRVSPSITAYTGITQAMIDGAPDPRGVLAQALALVGDSTLVAHGALFDAELLRRECLRAGLVPPAGTLLCSLHLSRSVYGHLREHSLASLAWSLQLSRRANAHRAAVDAETTAELMLRLAADVAVSRGEDTVSTQDLAQLMRLPPEPVALCA